MRSLYVIPARGGSKGVPKKNIRDLCGKPLIGYTLEVALRLSEPEDICVTTDDREITAIAEGYGIRVPFVRPAELATDEASQYEVVRHALRFYLEKGIEYDNVVLLQPTSPFRHFTEVKEQTELYSHATDMVVSVCKAEANPYFVLFEEGADGFLYKSKDGNYRRRQECPDVWQYNGSCYVINPRSLLEYNNFTEFRRIVKYVMPAIRSVDIDNEMDWSFCEFLLEKGLVSDNNQDTKI